MPREPTSLLYELTPVLYELIAVPCELTAMAAGRDIPLHGAPGHPQGQEGPHLSQKEREGCCKHHCTGKWETYGTFLGMVSQHFY
jgi:hypothetical protein